MTPIGVDEMAEWCNSSILILKPNGKVRLCLDPARLSQVVISSVCRGPTLNDISQKLNVTYLSHIDVSPWYQNLKLDKRSSYLTTFACQFGRYRYKRLPFGAAPAGDMFQCKINQILRNLPNVFGIADDISVVCYDIDGKDHDEMLWQVLQIYRQVNIVLNKDKCCFRCTSVPSFGEVICRH